MQYLAVCSILTGLAAASPTATFLVCLDDDVILSPDALQTLVAPLVDDPSLFMATGAIFPQGMLPSIRDAQKGPMDLGKADCCVITCTVGMVLPWCLTCAPIFLHTVPPVFPAANAWWKNDCTLLLVFSMSPNELFAAFAALHDWWW